MTLIKKETNEASVAKAAMLKADLIARQRRIEDEFNEKHNIKTPEDAERFIQKCKDEILTKTDKMQYNKPGKESASVSKKKKCLNCGSTQLVRQYDETKTTQKNIVWTNEYRCLTCKERFGCVLAFPKRSYIPGFGVNPYSAFCLMLSMSKKYLLLLVSKNIYSKAEAGRSVALSGMAERFTQGSRERNHQPSFLRARTTSEGISQRSFGLRPSNF